MKVIFCLPGGTFTGGFIDSWTNLIKVVTKIPGVSLEYRRAYSPNIYTARNLIIGGSDIFNVGYVPTVFDGKPYDYSFWIDSDILFSPEDVTEILNLARKYDLPVLAGLYPAAANDPYDKLAVAGRFGAGRLMLSECKRLHDPVLPVEFTGWGFTCVKQGVFELLGYPWLHETHREVEGRIMDLGDDFSFCLHVKEKGFQPYVCPHVIVGHEKKTILWGRDQ